MPGAQFHEVGKQSNLSLTTVPAGILPSHDLAAKYTIYFNLAFDHQSLHLHSLFSKHCPEHTVLHLISTPLFWMIFIHRSPLTM